jgi:phosphate transport system substrate-binding protein
VALRSRLLLAVVAAAPLALAAACGEGGAPPAAAPGGGIPAGPAPGPQTLPETGSTLLYPLLRTWASAYHQQHGNVSISTAATGSGKGIAAASAGTVDIGASDAYLSSDMVTNPAMLNVPLAISAQQVNYNLPGLKPGIHVRLDGPALAQMYQGTITAWNDPRIAALNPGVALPGTRVVPLRAALACAQAGVALPGGRLLGCEFTERGLQFGLERSYRAGARLATDRRRRIELVDAANSVRPRTWA